MYAFGHVFTKQSFLFLLGLEIKKAQRYRNCLGLLSLTFTQLSAPLENPTIPLKTLGNVLRHQMRETDIVGQGGTNRLLVMLAHADVMGAQKVIERVEQALHHHGMREKGLAMEIHEVCFPTRPVDDLLRMAASGAPVDHP
jgi:hypothetical protein